MRLRSFYGQRPNTLLWTGWRAALLQLTAYFIL